MPKTTFMLAALFVAVLGGGYWWHATQAAAPSVVPASGTPSPTVTQESPSSGPSQTPTGTGTPASPTFTAAEVAAHDSAQSCYTSINGSVYDLTPWISQHPGGPEAILSICGTDGTAAFEAQHGGERRPNQELATFKIGALAP
ncbi:MAG TPA: cytochrome b5 domain-containing protein [Candidatus Paceibacterota bacterium]|nr:cytochrome b5 domain-containing protein [Candidatus Paceibacterota bacterium]